MHIYIYILSIDTQSCSELCALFCARDGIRSVAEPMGPPDPVTQPAALLVVAFGASQAEKKMQNTHFPAQTVEVWWNIVKGQSKHFNDGRRSNYFSHHLWPPPYSTTHFARLQAVESVADAQGEPEWLGFLRRLLELGEVPMFWQSGWEHQRAQNIKPKYCLQDDWIQWWMLIFMDARGCSWSTGI